MDNGQPIDLLFHKKVKQPGNFVCNDGSHISSNSVCDSIKNCFGEEDEDAKHCNKIIFPSYYHKHPPKSINVTLEIQDILGVNEHKFSFDIVFKLTLRWYDKALFYKYLSENEHSNIISSKDQESMWLPFINYDHIQYKYENEQHPPKVFKSKPFMFGSIDQLEAVEMYSGSDTPIEMGYDLRMKFFCGFEKISEYPFGQQTCNFTFKLRGPASTDTELNGVLKTFGGDKVIGKYRASTWKIQHFIDEEDNTRKITISVQLIRSITSILLVTFLPTFLMNIINLATIHIEVDSKYEVIIMVNITSLVVLASIYVSVSSSLKSTPEIKPVEIWLLSNLVLPFMVIIETILLQVYIQKENMLR